MFSNGNSFAGSPAVAVAEVRQAPSILVRVTGGPAAAMPR